MSRHDLLDPGEKRAQTLKRLAVCLHTSPLPEAGQLDTREVVTDNQHPGPGGQHGHAVPGMSPCGMQLELAIAALTAAGDGEPLQRAKRERSWALDHQLFIEGPQLALGLPR